MSDANTTPPSESQGPQPSPGPVPQAARGPHHGWHPESSAGARGSGGMPLIDPVWRSFQKLLTTGAHVLVPLWLVTVLVDLVFVGVSSAILMAAGGERALYVRPPGAAMSLQIVTLVQMLLVGALRVGLYGPLRRMALYGPRAVTSTGATLRDLGQQALPLVGITALVGLIVTVGLMLCVVPGLIAAFLLAMAPYLVATRETGFVQALRQSSQYALHNWALMLMAALAALVGVLGLGCAAGISGSIAAGMGTLGVPMMALGPWLFSALVGFFVWLFWGAVFVIMETQSAPQAIRWQSRPQSPEAPPDSAARARIYPVGGPV